MSHVGGAVNHVGDAVSHVGGAVSHVGGAVSHIGGAVTYGDEALSYPNVALTSAATAADVSAHYSRHQPQQHNQHATSHVGSQHQAHAHSNHSLQQLIADSRGVTATVSVVIILCTYSVNVSLHVVSSAAQHTCAYMYVHYTSCTSSYYSCLVDRSRRRVGIPSAEVVLSKSRSSPRSRGTNRSHQRRAQ